jgi:uncharacterized protein YjbI with pentapeptide repeats
MAFRAQERGVPNGEGDAGAAVTWSVRPRRRWRRPEGPDDLLARLDKLQDAANAASGHARNVYVTFLLFGLYLAIIFGSTTHEQLLRESPVTLPLLNVGLPLFGFYWIAPALFVLLHLNLLLQFYLLSGKLHRFDHALEEALARGLLDEQRADERRAQLYPFPFSQMLVGRQHGRLMRFLLWLMVWLTVLVLPVVLLLMGQVRFLPYHDAWTTMWQRFMVLADILLILIFWRPIRHPADRLLRHPGRWLRHQAKVLSLGMIALAFSFLVFTFPGGNDTGRFGDPMATVVGRHGWLAHPSNVIFGSFSFLRRNLVVREVGLVASWPTQNQIDQFGEDLAWQNFGAPPDLRGRDLRFADLSQAILVRGDLGEANLEGAILSSTNLSGANLYSADLQGAYLTRANLQGAYLGGADLRRADLQGVNLRGADLSSANLQSAMISCDPYSPYAESCITDLRNARLEQADLQGANLEAALLQGADLSGADLGAANLGAAGLQGATFSSAQLRGADVSGADLRGAFLEGTDLRGAALALGKLQGADLRGTRLWRAEVGGNTDSWTFADLRDIDIDPIEDLDAWIEEEIRQIADDDARYRVAKQLQDTLRDDDRPDVPHFPDEWRSRPNVMFESDGPHQQQFGWGPPRWGTEAAYDEALADFLGELACGDTATVHVAQGLTRRARWDRERLYARRLAGRLLGDDCPPAADLPDELRHQLEELAARAAE